MGVLTSRDTWINCFSKDIVKYNANKLIENYNIEVEKIRTIDKDKRSKELNRKETYIKWSPNLEQSAIKLKEIVYEDFSYYMMNKPVGVLSSTEDRKQKTVLDLLSGLHRKDLFPVGRLDKDSEGLLLLMNDGKLAHMLLSPKNHIEKKYYVEIPAFLKDEDIAPLRHGIQYDKDLIAEPAKVHLLSAKKEKSAVEIIITEGKFHQIKKMFLALSERYIVSKLKRLSMGNIILDEELKAGEYRKLSPEEVERLKASGIPEKPE